MVILEGLLWSTDERNTFIGYLIRIPLEEIVQENHVSC